MKEQGLLFLSVLSILQVFSGIAILAIGAGGCATTYRVLPYPNDAEISVRNPITDEIFSLGKGKVSFEPKPEFGEGFIITAKRDGFKSKDIFVNKTPGAASNYLVTLEKDGSRDLASEKDPDTDADTDEEKSFPNTMRDIVNDEVRKRIDRLVQDAEENMRKAEEERRELMAQKLRLEFEKKALESQKRVALLESTFDIYKDALFSERYGRAPASFDRRRIDLTVDLVNRIQRDIDEKRLTEASELVDQLLERDEYLAKGHALKGTVKYLQNKVREAIVAWERALEIDPNDDSTRRYLNKVYQEQGIREPLRGAASAQIQESKFSTASSPRKPVRLRIREQREQE